jgi:2-haloacid dehalogenase
MIEVYHSRWPEMIKSVDQETICLMSDIKKAGYRVSALSNWSAETFPHVLSKHSFFKDFEEIVVSGFEKTVKPEKEIYEILLKRIKLPAEKCIFLDDVEKNIQGALDVGMHGIVFSNPAQCRSDLLKKGLKISP